MVNQRILGLSRPPSRRVVRERGLRVPLRDGTELLAERWYSTVGGDGLPVALIRTYYGPRSPTATGIGLPLAERGFQVIVVSSRGTFGSGGAADPFRCEREDGLDTIDWVTRQAWFGGSIVLIGASYLGYTQWAVADAAPDQVVAMIPAMTSSSLMPDFLRSDAFNLEVPFSWGVQVAVQEQRWASLRSALREPAVTKAMSTLPLADADVDVLGHHDAFIQNALQHDGTDPFWDSATRRATVADVTVPTSLVSGWYDIMLAGQLADFVALQNAGRSPRIIVGPWHHLSIGAGVHAVREALEFGAAHARGEVPPDRAPVRLYVMGAGEWRDYDSWPPVGHPAVRYHLQVAGGLATARPAPSSPDRYRYDPSDPTPALGGARLMFRAKKGAVDNRRLEARGDVLVFDTTPLDVDVEVVGEVSAEIWFRSNRPSSDVFVRLCDVDPSGRSLNVCDGLLRVNDAAEPTAVRVQLSPTAYRFLAGHRIRVQVSSGAFPRFNRNLGTGESRATAATPLVADQEVFHDPEHPSAIILPVFGAGDDHAAPSSSARRGILGGLPSTSTGS